MCCVLCCATRTLVVLHPARVDVLLVGGRRLSCGAVCLFIAALVVEFRAGRWLESCRRSRSMCPCGPELPYEGEDENEDEDEDAEDPGA